MNSFQKFCADIKRIVKHERSDNGGVYDGIRASKSAAEYFIQNQKGLGDLPRSIADYWFNTYIAERQGSEQQPSAQNIEWLAAAAELLNGNLGAQDEDCDIFSMRDWKELRTLVDYEAEDLPISVLTYLMSVFTERKVL